MSNVEINQILMGQMFSALIANGEAMAIAELYESGATRNQAGSISQGTGALLLQVFMHRPGDEALIDSLIQSGVVPDTMHFTQALNTKKPETIRKITDAMTEEGRREAIVYVTQALSVVNPGRYSFYQYSAFEHFLLEIREILVNGEPLPRGSLSFLFDKAPDDETRARFLPDLTPRMSFRGRDSSIPSGVGV